MARKIARAQGDPSWDDRVVERLLMAGPRKLDRIGLRNIAPTPAE